MSPTTRTSSPGSDSSSLTELRRFPSLSVSKSIAPDSNHSGSVCTIGNFDGLHLGHQLLIRKVVERAGEQGLRSILVSFYPHPVEVLIPGERLPRIASVRTQLKELAALKMDLLYAVRFTRALSQWSAEEFLDRVLVEKLRCRSLYIGSDFALGAGRSGTPSVLAELTKARGIECHVIEPMCEGTPEKIGSRNIRALLREGKVKEAATLLGKPYRLEGRVVRGDGRGRRIGVPTANLHLKHAPPLQNGVYVCNARLSDGSCYQAVTNVGIRPTFYSSERLSVEVHLFSLSDRDLYGERLEVDFLARIRDEQKFSSVEELQAQIAADLSRAKEFFS